MINNKKRKNVNISKILKIAINLNHYRLLINFFIIYIANNKYLYISAKYIIIKTFSIKQI